MPRFPTAILVTGMVIVAVLCFFAGLILDTVTRGRREVRRLAYLSHAGAQRDSRGALEPFAVRARCRRDQQQRTQSP